MKHLENLLALLVLAAFAAGIIWWTFSVWSECLDSHSWGYCLFTLTGR